MNEQELRTVLSSKIKVVRTEYDFNQDQMADILGISKKTLVQIEKGRREANWPVVVTFASLFRDSSIIQQELGEDDVVHLLQTLARKNINLQDKRRFINHSWWKTVNEQNGLILQKNLISQYYRIVDQFGVRLFSSFYKKSATRHFEQIVAQKEKDDLSSHL